ncbi:DUF4272 domain-containing protein [uncultured Kordia sp.]|uniref:DUF4272 domain-containing protein n=1 Tax=uncultured Kordia sp. TaxID=507699 RepID=UPI002615662F|nr:DUF4272 domain-containing protein [uncultured Kordia sp.]
MICTLYSHEIGYTKISPILRKYFPTSDIFLDKEDEFKILRVEIKGGFFSSKKVLKIPYRERINPDYQITEDENCPLNMNLQGLYGFANSLPIDNDNLRDRFLHKIHSLNAEFSIIEEKGTIKEIPAIIKDLAAAFDAILFVQDGTIISKAHGQHFLNNSLQLIVDREGNSEIDSLEVNIDPKYFDNDQVEVLDEQKDRKAKNETVLAQHNIKVNKNLPCVESTSEANIRSAKEIAQRVTVMAYINGFTLNALSGEDTITILKKLDLWEATTPKEKHLLENPTDEGKNQESWKCEGIWVLLWALKKVDSIPFPNEMIDFVNIPEGNYPYTDPKVFITETTEARNASEILDMNDLYYRMDWACVDARVKGEHMEAMIPGAVYERHYALNWLIHYMDQDWDDVTCDT